MRVRLNEAQQAVRTSQGIETFHLLQAEDIGFVSPFSGRHAIVTDTLQTEVASLVRTVF